MKIKHNLFCLLVWALSVIGLGSCTQDNLNAQKRTETSKDLIITVKLPDMTPHSNASPATTTAATTSPGECKVSSLVVMFFDSKTGVLERIQSRNDVGIEDTTSFAKFKFESIKDIEKPRDVYVLANWADYSALDFVVGQTHRDQLLSKMNTYTDSIPTPDVDTPASLLVMTAEKLTYNFAKDGALSMELQRQVAKISIKVEVSPQIYDAFPGLTFTEDLYLSLYNMPLSSYVVPHDNIPESTDFNEINDMEIGPSNDKAYYFTRYTYENLISGSDAQAQGKAVSILLQMPYQFNNGQVIESNFYRVNILTPQATTNPYSILRNNVYDITLSITGLGLQDDSYIPSIKVSPWDEQQIDVELPNTEFSVSSTNVTLKGMANTLLKITSENPDKIAISVTNQNQYETLTRSVSDNIVTYTLGAKDNLALASDPEFSKIKVTSGNLTKIVNVIWEPYIIRRFASGDLKANPTNGGKPVIGKPGDLGLRFRWGSLIGFSVTRDLEPSSTTTPIRSYVDYFPAGFTNYNVSWSNLPLISTYVNGDQFEGYQIPNETITTNQAIGDICTHSLGNEWRLPTVREFRDLIAIGNMHKGNDDMFSGYAFGNNRNNVTVNTSTKSVSNADPILDDAIFLQNGGLRDNGGKASYVLEIYSSMMALTSTYQARLTRHKHFTNGVVTIFLWNTGYGSTARCIRK